MRYFMYDNERGESVDSSEAQPISLDQAIAVFSGLKFDADTFLGFIRNDGKILQFGGTNDRRVVLADMPVTTARGSFQLETVKEAGQEMIHEFFEGKNLEDIHRFDFRVW